MTPQRLDEIRRFYSALISRFHGVDAPLVGFERDAVLTLMGELLAHAEATTHRRNRPDPGEDGAPPGVDGMS